MFRAPRLPGGAGRKLLLVGLTAGLMLPIGTLSSARDDGVRSAVADAPPQLLRHPYLQKGTSHSMGVAWMIDDEQPCTLEFGPTRELGRAIDSAQPARMHFVEASDLEPGTRYYYRIRSGETWLTPDDESYYFCTHAADAGRPFSFVVLGDSGDPETGDQCPVADLLLALRPKPDFIIHTGDVSQRWAVDEAEYDLLTFGVYRDMLRNTPFYPTQGNHDWATDWEHGLDPLYPKYFAPGKLDGLMTERFDMPFWRVFYSPRDNDDGTPGPFSFRYGNAVFVCEGGAGRSAGQSFAERRFADDDVTWRFFYSHYFGLAGNVVQGGDIPWDPPLPDCDLVFRGHLHAYSRSAAYGPNQCVDLLVGTSGAEVAKGYFESVVTRENPHGLIPGVSEWNEKASHLLHVLIDGPRLTLKSYYPDGLVFDSLSIDKSKPQKQVVGMPLESHPVHPEWQRGLTPLMQQLWVDDNPKWRSLGSGLWDYTGNESLERFQQPIIRRSRYIEPRFVQPQRRNHPAPADMAEARTALAELTAVHYRLGHHEWDAATYRYFEQRFRHLFGSGDVSLPLLVQLADDESLPVKQRLGALGGVGILAGDSEAAGRQLVRVSESDDFNMRYSASIIRACWVGDRGALDSLFAWMKQEAQRNPPHSQFDVNAPGHYGNPVYVLRRFAFPALFGVEDAEQLWEAKQPTIEDWITYYETNRQRLLYDKELQLYRVE